MFTKIIFAALLAVVICHDLTTGNNTDGRKIFDANKQANPAIWRQTNNVTVTANEDEVISQIVVKDMRPEKDGEVKIVEGGEGHKNVTIELKSPTALRGYDFNIEVYAIPDTNKQISKISSDSKDASTTDAKDTPIIVSSDDSNRNARNLMKDEPNTTVLPEDCVTIEDFNKESMKISKDAQDHETVDFILNDSVKEDLKDLTDNQNEITGTSTTELDETTTQFEKTTEEKLLENTTEDKFENTTENNKEEMWNFQNFNPEVEMKGDKVLNDKTKLSGL